MLKKKILLTKEFFICTIFFIVAVCIRFFFSDFVKTIHGYPDELMYYGSARSLFIGGDLSIRNITSNFQKIGYSIFLAPLFFIKNGFLRIKLISLVNCVIMSLSAFPAMGIGRELKLGNKGTFFFIFLTLFWPDMATSMSFMSEILYWPLCLFFIWLWIYSCRIQKWWAFVFLAFLCYAGYLCKEIFLAFFIVAAIFPVISPIVNFLYEHNCRKKLISYFLKVSFINTGIFVVVFLALHAVFKLIFFKGVDSSYSNALVPSIKNSYDFFYMIKAFLIYMSAVIMAVCVFPVVYPAIYYKRLFKECRNLFVFSLLTILIVAVTVSYTISAKEDLGSLMPKLHMRYFAPSLIILMAVFLRTCQENLVDKNNFVLVNSILLFVLIFIGVVFKGFISLPCTLSWYKIPQKLFPTIDRGYEFVLRPYVIVINFCFTVAVLVLHFIKEKGGTKLFLKLFMILNCMLLLVSNIISIKSFKDGYSADKNIINELQKLNDFFSTAAEKSHVLYISAGNLASENGYFDTYFDSIQNLYFVREDDVLCKDTAVSDVGFREPESNKLYVIPRIDYIIIPSTLSLECENALIRDDLGGRYYAVYENINPFRVSIVQRSNRMVSFDWNISVSNGFDRDGVRYLNCGGSSYGPYWHLQKGSYEIEIKGVSLDGADITLYSSKGAVSYPFEAVRSDSKISIKFTLDSDVDNFEIYIKNKYSKTLEMHSLHLNAVGLP